MSGHLCAKEAGGAWRMIRSLAAAGHARGYLHYFGSNIAQQGIAFATVVVVAGLLPPVEFAVVRIAQAYLAVLLIVGAAGVTAPLLRYCADRKYAPDDRRRLFGKSLVIGGGVSITVVALCVTAVFARFPEASHERTVFIGYAAQLPALVAATIALVYLQALQSFRVLAVSQLATRALNFVLAAVATYAFGLTGLVLAMLVSAYFNAALMGWLAPPLLPRRGQGREPEDFARLARYSVFGMLVTTLGQSSDLMLLDALGVDRGAVGIYSLATVFFVAAGALIGTAQGVATPAFTAVMRSPVEFSNKLRRWTLAMAVAGIAASVLVYALAWAVERWLLGDRYTGFSSLLALLLVKFCLWSTYAVGGAALVGIGEIRKGSWIAVVTTALSFGCGVPLIARFGIWGAASMQVLVAVISCALIWWVILGEVARLGNNATVKSADAAKGQR